MTETTETTMHAREGEAGFFSLLHKLDEHARTNGHTRAILFPTPGGRTVEFTWRQLSEASSHVGWRLTEQGVQAGDRLLILSSSVSEQVLGFLGAMFVGAVPSILSYPSLKQSEDAFFGLLEPLAQRETKILSSTAFGDLLRKTRLPLRILEYPTGSPLGAKARLPSHASDVQQSPLFVQYSSGTTGARKAVAVGHEMFARHAVAYGRALDLTRADRVVSWLPLYHDLGLVASLLVPLCHGVESIQFSPFDWLREPASLFEYIASHRATLTWMPNFAFAYLRERVDPTSLPSEIRLDSLRAIINGSEPVRNDTMVGFAEHFSTLGIRREHLQVFYGMAENTMGVTQTRLGETVRVDRIDREAFASLHRAVPASPGVESNAVMEFVSCGMPIEGTEVRIANGNGERQIGEIEIRGVSTFGGYVDSPRGTSEFVDDGWFRTGDLGYLADGELFVSGRAKDLIIHRGHNIYPSDVEEAAGRVDGCKPGRVVVFGVGDQVAGTEHVVVMLEAAASSEPLHTLEAKVREEIMRTQNIAVRDVVIVPAGTLRKSTSGKLSRSANRADYLRARETNARRPPPTPEVVAPSNPLEAYLTEAWQEVLQVVKIGADEDLFARLGADSVTTLTVVGRLRKDLGIALEPDDIGNAPTVAAQVRLLEKRGVMLPRAASARAVVTAPSDPSEDGGTLVWLSKSGTQPPLVLCPAAGGTALDYRELADRLSGKVPVAVLRDKALYGLEPPFKDYGELVGRYVRQLQAEFNGRRAYLGGWSQGGLVVTELANELLTQGWEIPSVFIFEAAPPIPSFGLLRPANFVSSLLPLSLMKTFPGWERPLRYFIGGPAPSIFFNIVRVFSVLDSIPILRTAARIAYPEIADDVASLPAEKLIGRVYEHARAHEKLPGSDLDSALQAIRHYWRYADAYCKHRRTRKYPGKVVSFSSDLSLPGFPGFFHTQWKPYFTGTFDIHTCHVEQSVLRAHPASIGLHVTEGPFAGFAPHWNFMREPCISLYIDKLLAYFEPAT